MTLIEIFIFHFGLRFARTKKLKKLLREEKNHLNYCKIEKGQKYNMNQCDNCVSFIHNC